MTPFFISAMQRLAFSLLSALSLIAVVLCYQPGLNGGFLFDDVINIQNNAYLVMPQLDVPSMWQAAMSSTAGMFRRPISMLTFALNNYWGGTSPYYFKVVNLAIHLANGILVFVLTRILLKLYRYLHRPQLDEINCQWISLAVAALWLLHPLNLTGVLYTVQRMTSLSALFTCLGLILYLLGRKRQISDQAGSWPPILMAFFVMTPLAALSKENGFLLPVLMLVVEATILKWHTPSMHARRNLMFLFVVTVMLPALCGLIYISYHPALITGGYSTRDFTLVERLMTEARVLWFYLHMTLLPNIAAMGFYHDDFAVSRGLLVPSNTLAALLGLLALLMGGWMLRKKHPLISFGIFFFLIGHSMESSMIALELVHEHRNYLPIFGVLLPVVYYTLSPVHHPSSLHVRRIGMSTVIILFALLTWLRAGQWSNPLGMMQMEVQHHPESTRAHGDLAYQYAYIPALSKVEAEDHYRNAIFHFSQAAYLSENNTTGFFGILAVNSERGLPTDATWTDELERRLEHMPSLPGSINSLMALEKCLAGGRCTHSPELMERLLRAALRNPTLTGARRSAALFALSDFLIKIRNQPEQAAEVAYQAVAAAPSDMVQRLTLIEVLINMRKFDAAAVEINNAKIANVQSTYTSALATLEHQLAVAIR